MANFKVIYKHGQFIDTLTGKRIIPVQDAIYEIVGRSNSFREEDEKLRIYTPTSSPKKKELVIKKYGVANVFKIANAGSILVFRVGNSKKVDGDESNEYAFTCTILEDLYIYKNADSVGDEIKHWRLDNCVCILDKCVLGGLTLTEKISTHSLNKLFSHIVTFYFNMQRSGVCNAFNTFFFYEKNMEVVHDKLIKGLYKSLDDERKAVASSFIKK